MSLPQLQMRRWSLDDLPDADPRVRVATTAEIPALSRLLSLAFEELWTERRVREELFDHPNVPLTFVAEANSEVVATASLQHKAEFQLAGWVHWVGVDPLHRRQGLGRAVVVAVLHAARAEGKGESGLTTDDFRLPAIRSYLGLGFEPDPWHESHADRWSAVLRRLV